MAGGKLVYDFATGVTKQKEYESIVNSIKMKTGVYGLLTVSSVGSLFFGQNLLALCLNLGAMGFGVAVSSKEEHYYLASKALTTMMTARVVHVEKNYTELLENGYITIPEAEYYEGMYGSDNNEETPRQLVQQEAIIEPKAIVEPEVVKFTPLDVDFKYADAISNGMRLAFDKTNLPKKTPVVLISDEDGVSDRFRDISYTLVLDPDVDGNLTNEINNKAVINAFTNGVIQTLVKKYKFSRGTKDLIVMPYNTHIDVSIKKPQDEWDDPSLEDHQRVIKNFQSTKSAKYFHCYLAMSHSGDPIIWEFEKKQTETRLMLIGTSGAGKTVTLRGMLDYLFTRYTNEELKVVVFDLKGSEFNFKITNDSHIWYSSENNNGRFDKGRYYNESTGKCVVNGFDALEKEANHRADLFSKHAVNDITEFNEGVADGSIDAPKLPYILILVDEIHQLYINKTYKPLGARIMTWAKNWRSLGFPIVATTQGANSEEFPTIIRDQFTIWGTGVTKSPYQSKLATGDEQLAKTLTGNGDTYWRKGDGEPQRGITRFITGASFVNTHNTGNRESPNWTDVYDGLDVNLVKKEEVEEVETPEEIQTSDKPYYYGELEELPTPETTVKNGHVQQISVGGVKINYQPYSTLETEVEPVSISDGFVVIRDKDNLPHQINLGHPKNKKYITNYKDGWLTCGKCNEKHRWTISDGFNGKNVPVHIFRCNNCRKQFQMFK